MKLKNEAEFVCGPCSQGIQVRFLREKSETLSSFKILALHLKNEKWSIKAIRSDHGGNSRMMPSKCSVENKE
ncbi:unnamed protein product [Cochlearia groenlandica]